MLVGHFSPKSKEAGLGLSEIGEDETPGTQGKGCQGAVLFPVVQGRLGGHASPVPLGHVCPLMDTRLRSLYGVLGTPHTKEGGAHAPKGDMPALQKRLVRMEVPSSPALTSGHTGTHHRVSEECSRTRDA